jgi:hypothetical protein
MQEKIIYSKINYSGPKRKRMLCNFVTEFYLLLLYEETTEQSEEFFLKIGKTLKK